MTDKFKPFNPSRTDQLEEELLKKLELELFEKEKMVAAEKEPKPENGENELDNKKENFLTWEKFKKNFRDIHNYSIEDKSDLFDEEGNRIYFDSYNEETGQVTFFDSRIKNENNNPSRQTVSLHVFYDLLKKYKHRSPEEIKKEKEKGEKVEIFIKKYSGEGKEELTEEQFKEKYKPHASFFDGEKYHNVNGDKSCIGFNQYDHGKVFYRYRGPDDLNYRDRICTLDEFNDLLEKYGPQSQESRRAENAQAVINSEKSDLELAEEDDMAKKGEEKKAESKGEGKLEELMEGVEKSRTAYAKKDYEITNVWSQLKVLGKGLRSKPENIPEMKIIFDQYKTSLNNLLAYQIEKLKGQKLPDAEIESLIKYYNQDEKVNLYEARTKARAQVWENKFGKAPGWIAEKSGLVVNWYRKLNWKTKIGLGTVAALSGAGFLIVGQRALGGAATGVGAAALLEGRYRKKEGKKLEKNRTEIKADLAEIEDQEEKYKMLMGYMSVEIDDYQKSLRTEISKARNRKLIGAIIGVILGSGMASHMMHWGLDKSGAEQYISKAEGFLGEAYEKYFPKDAAYIDHPNARMPVIPQEDTAPDAPKLATKGLAPEIPAEVPPAGAPVQELPKDILTIQKGSSFEGAIIKHLTENGVDKPNAQGMAHRMYLDYLKHHIDPLGKDFNLVHPGAKFEIGINPEGNYFVENFEDSPRSQWAQKYGGKVKILSSAGPEVSETPPVDSGTDDHLPSAYNYMAKNTPYDLDETPIPKISKDEVILGAAVTGAGAAGVALAEAELDEIDSKNKVVDLNQKREEKKKAEEAEEKKKKTEVKAEKEKIKAEKELDKEKIKIEKKYKFEKDDEFEQRALNCIKAISLSQENWRFMSKLKFSDLKRELSPKLLKNVNKFEKDMALILGEQIKHQEGETVQRWLARVVSESLGKDKIAERPFTFKVAA